MAGRERLADRAAGVVAHEVDAGEPDGVAEVGDEAGQARQREVLVSSGRGVPVQRQVDRHAAALAVELVDHMAPQVAAGGQAVDEQRHAARAAGIDVAGWTRLSAHLAAAGVEALCLAGHEFLPSAMDTGYSGTKDRPAV